MTVLGVADYIVIGFMLAVSASVGLFFRFTGGKQKTTREFLMADKNMKIAPVAFSLMATYMSAIAVLGVPAETYNYGTQYFMYMAGMPIGSLIVVYGMLPVFYHMDVSTAYEYLERRFGKTMRTAASLLFTIQMMFYMAVVLYAPSLALNAVTGLSTWMSVISLAVVCTFYCSLGGLKAVLWTDVFQSILMYITIIAVVVKAAIDMGGLGRVVEIASDGGRLVFFNMSFDVTERYTFWNAFTSGIIFSLHTFGTNQAQIQRMLSVGDLKRAQWAQFWSQFLILIFNFLCFCDGAVIYSYFHECDPLTQPSNKLDSADQLLPYAVLKMFGAIPGLPGLCIAGVFSASLSTISSAVNSLTAVTMEDFIRPFCFCKRLSESWAAFLAKVIAIGYGGLCLLLTFIVANFRGVLEASNVMFGMVGGPTIGIYILGMFTTTANEPGTLIGLMVGFAVHAWIGFGSYAAKWKIAGLPTSIEGCTVPPNATLSYFPSELNGTILIGPTLDNSLGSSSLTEGNEDVFLLYKVAYLWFPVISATVVFVVGYIASFIIGLFKKYPPKGPENYSPFVRRCYFGSTDHFSQDGYHPDLELKNKTSAAFASSNTFKVSHSSKS